MAEQVGSIIAAHHAKRLECPVCGRPCEPDIISITKRGKDSFERLRCTIMDGRTFQRIWIGGYR